jgi:hypothetical protein
MEKDKGKGGEYSQYPPPEIKLGKPQPTKRVYCYSSWTFPSRRFLRRGKIFLGLGLPPVPGVREGFGGMGMWRLFLTVLPRPSCCGGIGVRIVG